MNFLIIGSAQCVWEDLRSVHGEHFDRVITINRMIRYAQNPSHYGVSVHTEQAPDMRREGVPMVCPHLGLGVDIAFDRKPYRHGSSALYGVGFALLIGATRIVLAGCPLDESPHYYEGPGLGPDLAVYRDPWRQCLDTLRGRVFSLSGWTRELLGSPF